MILDNNKIISKMVEIKNNTTKIDSCEIHYLEAGNKGSLTVILLHGMKFQAKTWLEIGTLEQLANAGFHAIAVDMPGFGKSPACAVDQNRILRHFIETNEQQVILAGPSMGGRIALEFTLNHPDSLKGLVLIGSVGVKENENRLPAIHIPTLIVWGGEDQISPLENSEILSSTISESKKIIIDGAPHPCYLDNPEIWHKELINFLNSFN